MKLSRFSVERPVFTTMVMLIVLILGSVALYRLPIDLMPEITYPTLTVITDYENAGPEEMEEGNEPMGPTGMEISISMNFDNCQPEEEDVSLTGFYRYSFSLLPLDIGGNDSGLPQDIPGTGGDRMPPFEMSLSVQGELQVEGAFSLFCEIDAITLLRVGHQRPSAQQPWNSEIQRLGLLTQHLSLLLWQGAKLLQR